MSGELYYHHQDEQLSVTLLSDRVGKVRDHYRYSAFGEMLEGSESVENRIRYIGQQYDGISDRYYLRARYYNPVVGRFLQEDVYQGDGLNLYAYYGNDPVMYCDPSGYTSTGTGYTTAPVSRGGPDCSAPLVTKSGRPIRFKVYGQDHGPDIVVIMEPGGEGIITGYVK